MTNYTENRIKRLESKINSLNKKRLSFPVGSYKRKSINMLILTIKEMIEDQK